MMKLLMIGDKKDKAKMVSLFLALFDKQTIELHSMEPYLIATVEGFDRETGKPKTETLTDLIGIDFNFIVFEEDGDGNPPNPYLERLREKGEELVARILDNGNGGKTITIFRSTDNKPLELNLKP